MATINQDPAGQASVTLSGISFSDITATVSPVRIPARITVEGGSFAVSFGASTIINIETPLTAGAIALLDAPGDNAVSTVALFPAQISATRTDRLVAVADPLPGLLVAAEQVGLGVVVVAASAD
jgi:hypothetical protein